MENITKLRAIVCRAGEPAKQEEIESGLSALQRLVDGYIEIIYPFDDDVCIICNEEGKINGLPLNRSLYDNSGNIYDIIAGTFAIVGLTEDAFASLSDELAAKYMEMFKHPEIFVIINGKIKASRVVTERR